MCQIGVRRCPEPDDPTIRGLKHRAGSDDSILMLENSCVKIDVERPTPDAVVLTAAGVLDIATTPELRTRLDEVLATPLAALTVDLTDVTFIDSTALAALAHANRRLRGGTELLVLLGEDSYARVILEATGLDRVLNVVTARAVSRDPAPIGMTASAHESASTSASA
jgi:anti-sigma B factor antagonist